jgi:hypothetical protein
MEISLEESIETGVIYQIINTVNNKKYIGKAYSFVKHVRNPNYKHGTNGRFKRHLSNALNGNNEIPLLYNDIRHFGSEKFKAETLEVCLKKDLNQREEYYIKTLESFKDNIGYNYLIGNNKPEDNKHKKEYEQNKIESNKARAIGGKLRRSTETRNLPPNIYKRNNGLFAQIKIDSVLYNKSFLNSIDTDIEKLDKATRWLIHIKETHNQI